MYDVVVQQIEHRVVRQDFSAQVHHSDVSGQSGFSARIARSTCYEPNVGLDESGNLCLWRTAMIKFEWKLKNLSSDKLHLL